MRKQGYIIALLCVLVLCVAVAGCTPNTPAPNVAVTSITITGIPDNNRLEIGEEAELSYSYNPSDASEFEVSWESSSEAVATIDADGKLSAIAVGFSFITAKVVGTEIEDTFTLTVWDGVVPVPATSVSILGVPTNRVVEGGAPFTLTATLQPSNTTDLVGWTSSNPSVASVANGVVTPLAVGTATIKAAVVGNTSVFDEVIITVYPASIDGVYTDNLLSLTNIVAPVASTTKASFNSSVFKGTASDYDITYSQDAEGLKASVSENRYYRRTIFTPIHNDIFSNDKYYTITITAKITTASAQAEMLKTVFSLTWHNSVEEKSGTSITFTELNKSETISFVAGKDFTSFSFGTKQGAQAYSMFDLIISSIEVEEFVTVEGFAIVGDAERTVRTDSSDVQLQYTIDNQATASAFEVEWASSSAHATITNSGLVSFVSAGTAVITASVVGQPTQTSTVTFIIRFIEVDTISITGVPSADFDLDTETITTYQLGYSAMGTDDEPCPFTVSWSSSNTNVVTVSASGQLEVVGMGDAIITLRVDGQNKSDTFSIHVYKSTLIEPEIDSFKILMSSEDVSAQSKTVLTTDTITLTTNVVWADDAINIPNPVVISWSSDNTGVADIDEYGEITIVTTGEVRFTASINGTTYSQYVILNIELPDVSALSFSNAPSELERGRSASFTVSGSPSPSKPYTIDWTYSVEGVVLVSGENGAYTIVAFAEDVVEVTATVSGKEVSNSFTVTVTGTADNKDGVTTERFEDGAIENVNGKNVYMGSYVNAGARKASGVAENVSLTSTANERVVGGSGRALKWTVDDTAYSRRLSMYYSLAINSASLYTISFNIRFTSYTTSTGKPASALKMTYGYRTGEGLWYDNSTAVSGDEDHDCNDAKRISFADLGDTVTVEIHPNADWNGEFYIIANAGYYSTSTFIIDDVTIIDNSIEQPLTNGVREGFDSGVDGSAIAVAVSGGTPSIENASTHNPDQAYAYLVPMGARGNVLRWAKTISSTTASTLTFTYADVEINKNYRIRFPLYLRNNSSTTATDVEVKYTGTGGEVLAQSGTLLNVNDCVFVDFIVPSSADFTGVFKVVLTSSTATFGIDLITDNIEVAEYGFENREVMKLDLTGGTTTAWSGTSPDFSDVVYPTYTKNNVVITPKTAGYFEGPTDGEHSYAIPGYKTLVFTQQPGSQSFGSAPNSYAFEIEIDASYYMTEGEYYIVRYKFAYASKPTAGNESRRTYLSHSTNLANPAIAYTSTKYTAHQPEYTAEVMSYGDATEVELIVKAEEGNKIVISVESEIYINKRFRLADFSITRI